MPEGDNPLGYYENTVLLLDDDVRICRVPGTEHGIPSFWDKDFYREDTCVVFLFSFQPDFMERTPDGIARKGSHFQFCNHPFFELTDIDLVDRSLEFQP